GANVDPLPAAREALTQAPAGARCNWRATCNWIGGTHSNSTVPGFYGLGAEPGHRTPPGLDADHPELLGSRDHGATPVEYVLVGLAGCLPAGVAAVAQNRDIRLRSVKATLEGSMDILGILGADPDVRNGFDDVKVVFEIDADA